MLGRTTVCGAWAERERESDKEKSVLLSASSDCQTRSGISRTSSTSSAFLIRWNPAKRMRKGIQEVQTKSASGELANDLRARHLSFLRKAIPRKRLLCISASPYSKTRIALLLTFNVCVLAPRPTYAHRELLRCSRHFGSVALSQLLGCLLISIPRYGPVLS